MENPEEILHSLEEFSKLKPKDIPRELEEYLCFVAKTGDPVYQWGTIKSLFREKLINVITDFYESCPSVDIPPCPNVEVFNYETMKTFILEKLDTFSAAPFTVQRISELLTTPRKEYNRIDKYMRALEKNILVVSTTEPGNRRAAENGEGIVNGLESEHLLEPNNTNNDINVEEMDETPVWSRIAPDTVTYQNSDSNNVAVDVQPSQGGEESHSVFTPDARMAETNCASNIDSVITCRPSEEQPYVSIEPVASDSCLREDNLPADSDVTVTITAIPAAVQKRRDSIEPVVSSGEENNTEQASDNAVTNEVDNENNAETSSSSSISDIPSEEIVAAENETINNADISTSSTLTSDEIDEENKVKNEDSHEAANTDSSTLVQIPCAMTNESNEQNLITNSEDTQAETNKHDLDSNSSSSVRSPETEREAVATDSPEVITTVTSTNEIVHSSPQKVLDDDSMSESSKEGSVSSSDDIPKELVNVELSEQVNETKEDSVSRSSEEEEVAGTAQCDLAVECASDSSSDIQTEQDEQSNDKSDDNDNDNESFASSSTNPQPMEIDISEESCQEPPTSQS